MSLVGFKAQNHRQQTAKRGARPEVDNLATAPEVFDPLHERFRFTIDVAALPHNAKLERYFTPEQDGLRQSWAGERVWLNPPYSDIEPWVQKAHGEWLLSSRPQWGGPELIVMLVPANRCEQGWWQRQVEPHRRADTLAVEFLAGRLRFIKHGHDRVEPNQRPPFGCALLIWGDGRTP
jgi:phage N-6-adenine-methyltransferase